MHAPKKESTLILVLVVSVLIYFYLGLSHGGHWSSWPILSTLFIGMMSFPFRKLFKFQIHLSFIFMGVISFLLMFTLLRDLNYLLTKILFSNDMVWGLTITCLLVGFVKAISGPKIIKVNIAVKNLPDELVGFKIAQISDLHIGATIGYSYVKKVVNKINALDSNLIVLTGDIGDGKVAQYRNDIAPLGQMKSTYGSFVVTGNHEYYWNANEWLGVMNNLGIINLVNRGKIIEHHTKKILVAGIPDPVSRLMPDLAGMMETSAEYKILLSHRPGIAKEASQCGYDLQLSGHTHGGQFFPWTIVVKFVHRMSKGLHKVNSMWLYVSPGTGSWGPLIRLGTTPEITLLTLTQSKNEAVLLT